MKSFVHLHTHSDLSLWLSTARINDLVQAAKSEGMSALALTDDCNLFGASAFSRACEAGPPEVAENHDGKAIKPIIGCDLGLADSGRTLSGSPVVREKSDCLVDRGSGFRPVLLVQDDTGYTNLCSILSAYNGVGEERLKECPSDFLATHSNGLVALSGGRNGELSGYLAMGANRKARECAAYYLDAFGKDRYWLELIPRGFQGWRRINTALIRLATELGIGLVATNDVRFTRCSDRRAFGVFSEAGRDSSQSEPLPAFTGREAWLKSALEMDSMFGHVPGAIENSLRIAEMIEFRLRDRKPSLPAFGVSMNDTNQLLHTLAHRGMEQRYGQNHPVGVESRLVMELAMTEQIQLAPWFLTAKEHVDLARAAGIGVGPGRGALPGSLLAYCLFITDLDPFLFGLLPFQFFESATLKLPTFDLDFEYDRREELLNLVEERWGRDHVAFIPTFRTLRPLAALRMAGTGLGYPESVIGGAAGYVFEHSCKVGARCRKVLETAAVLEKCCVGVNLHAAGCVVAGDKLMTLVPLFRDRDTQVQVVQCPLDQLGRKGLSQFNFLGLRAMDEIARMCKLVKLEHPEFDLSSIPFDDELVWRHIGQGETEGIFGLESDGFRTILRDCSPASLVELAVLNALYRPGTMSMIPVFRTRKLEGESWSLPHACLEPILRESYGLPVFNEQITLAITALTGCKGTEAERQRILLASRRTSGQEMEVLRDRFINHMIKRHAGSTMEASGAFNFIRLYAARCFMKSHSLAYCLIAYRQLWLRVRFPEFALVSGTPYTSSKGA